MQPSIGLGVLGSAIAPHLVESGYSVTGYDIDADCVRELESQGINAGKSPRALAADCDVLILCLPTVSSLHEVVAGADGIDKAPAPGQIVIEISTFPVEEKERARAALATVDKSSLAPYPQVYRRRMLTRKLMTPVRGVENDSIIGNHCLFLHTQPFDT